ncbi:MAG: DNA mismatch repair protein MutL [Candidatus Dichloromethanomonas elyunquensis]|nr:MAG: DNA mismatch repair protein MutL [Candidatus Dichloromethanomonas elyunquensis]
MNRRIKLLDPHCVNQIAAGEVVERPLSVVKELIENSLDAGAKRIEIQIEGGGTSFIRIKDDGSGILPDDLPLAVLPHATSKITTINDLDRLQTLGFRGEALPSIASVSKLNILSRPSQEISGREIRIEGGELLGTSETGCSHGTVVTVRELFYNTPARHKFLRSNTTEFGLISDMVGRMALARPGIALTLRHPNNLILNTPGNGNLLEVIASVLGRDTARRLIPVSMQEEDLSLTGYLSPPDIIRSANTGITFIVNGRVIRSQLLNLALRDGYHTLIPSGSNPVAVIALTMPPADYDVNIHPAKLDVKFKKEKEIKESIAAVVRDTLLRARPLPNFTSYPRKEQHPQKEPSLNGSEQLRILYKEKSIFDEEKVPANDNVKVKQQDPVIAENQLSPYSLLFEKVRPIGQVFLTYLLCTDEDRLYIIDQHAAHERIRYEELLGKLRQEKIASQTLLIPETFDLTIQEEQVMLQYLIELQDIGFIAEHFGDRTYLLRGIPVLNHLENPGEIFRLFLEEIISKSFPPSRDQLLEKWVFMLACRTAIKGTDPLSVQEMEELIQRLGQTSNPLSCPHGRPTIITISKEELENRFYR